MKGLTDPGLDSPIAIVERTYNSQMSRVGRLNTGNWTITMLHSYIDPTGAGRRSSLGLLLYV